MATTATPKTDRFIPCPHCKGRGQFGVQADWAAFLGIEPPEDCGACGGSGDLRDYRKRFPKHTDDHPTHGD